MTILPLAICYPDQCCTEGYCIDEIHLHNVTRATAEDVAEAVGRLIDRALHDTSPSTRHASRIPARRSGAAMADDETCCACSGPVHALVVDGAFRKPVCASHAYFYERRGYQVTAKP